MDKVKKFFGFARERYLVFHRRQIGRAWPWTKDKVLQEYYFCNIFREDDKTTQWCKRFIRDPLAGPQMLLALIAFRWFNRIKTGELLLKHGFLTKWDSTGVRELLHNTPGPHFTGAFIIKSPNGMNKIDGICWCIDNIADRLEDLDQKASWSTKMEEVWRYLMTFPYLGGFMAYEIVCDLRWTPYLYGATDINTWAHPGPGARRGMNRVQARMHELLALSRDDRYWPRQWPKWEMREVEHTLCEFDKYERAEEGGNLKRRYHSASHSR